MLLCYILYGFIVVNAYPNDGVEFGHGHLFRPFHGRGYLLLVLQRNIKSRKKKTVINIRRIIYVGIAVSEFIRVMKKKKPIKYKCKNINGVTHLLRKKRHYLCDDGVQTLRDFRLDKKKKKSQLCRYALTCTYYPYIRRMCCKNTGVTIY